MPIEVELYTQVHIIRGTLETAGYRLSDTLNNKTESGLVMQSVEVNRLLTVSKAPPLQLPLARIEKSSLLLAVPIAERDLTHKSIYKRATRRSYDVLVFLPNFELHGTIHLTERLDVRRSLMDRTDDYIPLTNATATYVLHPRVVIKAGTIIFNKHEAHIFGEPQFAGAQISKL